MNCRARHWIAGAGAAALAFAAAATVAAQRPSITIDEDDITIRGCVKPASADLAPTGSMLAWSRNDIMLAAASARTDASAMSQHVFYWLDDHDDELAKHVGQFVEVKGDLGDFKQGELKIDRDDDFTEIELDLDGHDEKARVPTAWLNSGSDKDQEFDIVARRIDVEDVDVVGACDRLE